jgi:hypothetical protein
MKEVKQLKQEMLQIPGWTKRKSVEIAVFAAKSCQVRDDIPDSWPNEAIDAAEEWLHSGEKSHLKEKAKNAKQAEKNASGRLGVGGEADYFAARSARCAVEAARKKSEKRAAKYAAKAIHAAALSKGWEKPTYEGGMVEQHNMVEEDFNQAIKRIRERIRLMVD